MPPDHADSKTTEKTHRSSRQALTKKRTAERSVKQRETVSVKHIQQTEKCEACGKPIGDSGGTKIDSGQILCASCIGELRKQ